MTTDTPILNGWRFRFVLSTVLVSAIGYVVFSLWAGWDEVHKATLKVGMGVILIALLLSLVNYGLRYLRWEWYLAVLGHKINRLEHIKIYVSGFSLTTTPGKAGEALRSVFLKRYHISYTDSLAALVSERFSDVIAVLILTAVGISGFPDFLPVAILFLTAGLFFIAIIWTPNPSAWLSNKANSFQGKFHTILLRIAGIMHQTHKCNPPKILVFGSLVSIVAWGAEAYAFYLVLHYMDVEIAISTAIFIYSMSMLAGAVSFMPGGLGGAEAAMTALLVASNVDMPQAVAATVIIRLATLWFAVLLGGGVLYLLIKPKATSE